MKNIFLKKTFFVFCLISFFSFVWATDSSEKSEEEKTESEIQKRQDTIMYGMESDITSLLSTLISEKDDMFSDKIFELFNSTRNITIKESVIKYFIELKDNRLKDYCIEVLMDPYDEKTSHVSAILQYVSTLEIKEASPYVLQILQSDSEDFYDSALNVIGKIGGVEEAKYLVECLEDEDLPLARRQSLMKALGQLKVVETYDDLVEIAKDEDENTFVRVYALESAASMENESIIPVLVDLFSHQEPKLRVAVIQGLSNFYLINDEVVPIILDGLKDNHASVRLKSAEVVKEKQIEIALPYLIYRAKNDSDKKIVYECYNAIAKINTLESVEFLDTIIKNKSINETARAKAIDAVLEYRVLDSYDAIVEVALLTLKDDKLKNLRYAIGKALSKYDLPMFESVCLEYLNHKDVATIGTGLDIMTKNKYPSLISKVEQISEDKKAGVNQRKAKLVLEKIRR
jgi:HEAT repeat protein